MLSEFVFFLADKSFKFKFQSSPLKHQFFRELVEFQVKCIRLFHFDFLSRRQSIVDLDGQCCVVLLKWYGKTEVERLLEDVL